MKKIFLFLIIFNLIYSCSAKEKKITAKEYYNLSLKNIKKGNLITATSYLEEIESEYPYSEYIVRAEILIAFLAFVGKKYDEALLSADKFIQLRPVNDYVSYMYLLKAEASYLKRSNFLREQETTENSINSFQQLLYRFPDNKKYGKFANKRIESLKGIYAHYFLDIARKHLFRKEYLPAIKRLNVIIRSLPQSKISIEAKYRLVEAYLAMGLISQAKYESKLLTTKYPKSVWSKYSTKLIEKNANKIKH